MRNPNAGTSTGIVFTGATASVDDFLENISVSVTCFPIPSRYEESVIVPLYGDVSKLQRIINLSLPLTRANAYRRLSLSVGIRTISPAENAGWYFRSSKSF